MGFLSSFKKKRQVNYTEAIHGWWLYCVERPIPGACQWDVGTVIHKQRGLSSKPPLIGGKDRGFYDWEFVGESDGEFVVPLEHRLVNGKILPASIPALSGRSVLVDMILDKEWLR